MKRSLFILLAVFVLLSLACLTAGALPASTPTPASEEIESGAVFELPTPVEYRCAVVIAVQALHLRQGPSENDIVLSWLRHGERVRVLESNGDWWRIERDGLTGFARSSYLSLVNCE